MSYGHIEIVVGGVYSNELGVRFLEHRRVTGREMGRVQFEVVFGKRLGALGSCTPETFWNWQRRVVPGS